MTNPVGILSRLFPNPIKIKMGTMFGSKVEDVVFDENSTDWKEYNPIKLVYLDSAEPMDTNMFVHNNNIHSNINHVNIDNNLVFSLISGYFRLYDQAIHKNPRDIVHIVEKYYGGGQSSIQVDNDHQPSICLINRVIYNQRFRFQVCVETAYMLVYMLLRIMFYLYRSST